MKKYLLILATFILMFVFVGKVSAAEIPLAHNAVDIGVEGDEDARFKLQVILTKDYKAGEVIEYYETKLSGVDHFTTTFITDNFEVVDDQTTTVQVSHLKLKTDLAAGTYDIATLKVWHVALAPDETCVVSPSFKIQQPKTCADSKPDEGVYYDDNGNTITAEDYNYLCTPHYCTSLVYKNVTYYYNEKGEKVDSEEEMLVNCKCRHDLTTDKYYDLQNKEVTKEEYEKVCLCREEEGKDGKIYYCKQGELCTKEEFDNQCPDTPPTGSSLPIALVAGGILIAGGAVIITSKRNKFGRI